MKFYSVKALQPSFANLGASSNVEESWQAKLLMRKVLFFILSLGALIFFVHQ